MTEQTTETNETVDAIVETPVEKRGIFSTILLMLMTYGVIAVSVIGLPLGTLFFAIMRKQAKGRLRDNWIASLVHFFKCGLVTLLLAALAVGAYVVYLKFNQPVQTF